MRSRFRRSALAMLLALLSICTAEAQGEAKQYYASFLDVFDTVTIICGVRESEAEFQLQAEEIHDALMAYHRLFDIYNEYPGINNLKTVNDAAGGSPVKVDTAILELLQDCRAACALTSGRVNVAMGSVLSLWHEARSVGLQNPEKARLPDGAALQQAAQHMNFENVQIDLQSGTVCISDSALRLDVGAIAKGWAVERVARNAPEGLLISVGGNVRAVGAKNERGTPWVIGIENPDGGDYLHTIRVIDQSVVTSGDYQRFYRVDGKTYAHIIDPDTLYPPETWRSVTVVCPDSAWADVLSTALFLLPQAEGEALLAQADACAMWVSQVGECFYSSGFLDLIQS